MVNTALLQPQPFPRLSELVTVMEASAAKSQKESLMAPVRRMRERRLLARSGVRVRAAGDVGLRLLDSDSRLHSQAGVTASWESCSKLGFIGGIASQRIAPAPVYAHGKQPLAGSARPRADSACVTEPGPGSGPLDRTFPNPCTHLRHFATPVYPLDFAMISGLRMASHSSP